MLRSAFAIFGLLTIFACPVLAELTWDKAWQDFHRSPSDRHLETDFVFRNAGKTPVTIRKIKKSCGCTTARLDKKTFAPGEQGSISVKFTFGSRHGPHRKVITVQTDEKPEPTELNLVVWIHDPLTVSPALVFWRKGDAKTARLVQLAAEPGTAVHVKNVTSSNPRITAKLETIKAGQQYALTIEPADTNQREAAEITVETDFPSDQPRSYTIFARVK